MFATPAHTTCLLFQVLQLAAAGQTSPSERMARFLAESWAKFQQFFVAAATVESSEERFNIDEYSDATQISKPSITITPCVVPLAGWGWGGGYGATL